MHVLVHLKNPDLSFQPKKPTEFFALQIARRLNDADHLGRYIELAEHYGENRVVQVLRSLMNRHQHTSVGIESLEVELARIRNRISHD